MNKICFQGALTIKYEKKPEVHKLYFAAILFLYSYFEISQWIQTKHEKKN